MTDRGGQVLIVYAPGDSHLDYGRRIGRRRWRKALGAGPECAPGANAAADDVLTGRSAAVVVRDELAIPAPIADVDPAGLFAGRVVPALPLRIADAPRFQTLRELEASGLPRRTLADPDRARTPAVGFDVEFLAPRRGETLTTFTARLFEQAERLPFDPSFRALVWDDPSGRDWPDLTPFLPRQVGRLCDVGALGSETMAALGRLVEAGERFDAFVFAGVLENLEDPVGALALARKAALPDAVLVATVPNVAQLSLVRDLLLGRWDPMPQGPCDARHLRWFDRRFFAEAIDEAGWSVERVESCRETPEPEPEANAFLSRLSDWPGLDRDSLTASRWIVVAHAADRSRAEEQRSDAGREASGRRA